MRRFNSYGIVTAFPCMRAAAVSVLQAFNQGPAAHIFTRTASIELGDIYRTASAISVFLEEADARPFINRLMSMPVMNADGVVSRPVIDASTINPNIEVCLTMLACLTACLIFSVHACLLACSLQGSIRLSVFVYIAGNACKLHSFE